MDNYPLDTFAIDKSVRIGELIGIRQKKFLSLSSLNTHQSKISSERRTIARVKGSMQNIYKKIVTLEIIIYLKGCGTALKEAPPAAAFGGLRK